MKFTFIGMVISLGILLACPAETLTVAQDGTYAPSSLETFSGGEIHGTVNITGTKTATTGLTFDPAASEVALGATSGDRAVVNVGDYGRVEKGVFLVGGPSASGCFIVGGKRPNDANASWIPWNGADTHLALGGLILAEDASSETGVIDVMRLNSGASAGLLQTVSKQRLINRSTAADMRLLFNGGYFAFFNAFNTTYAFTTKYNTQNPGDVPADKGGRSIILEGVDGNPVDLRFVNGSQAWATYGDVRFRGRGDVRLWASGAPTYPFAWNWNAASTCWQQNGNLVLSGGFRLVCKGQNVLPCAATNGIVRVVGNEHCYLDLAGFSQVVNGLEVVSPAALTNSSSSIVTLTIGAGKSEGVLSVGKIGNGGPIRVVKQGTGTLRVSNTPYFPEIVVSAGTLHVAGNMRLNALELGSGTTLCVDGGTLTVSSYHGAGATVTTLNGGRILIQAASSEDALLPLGAQESTTAQIEKSGTGTLALCPESPVALGLHVAAGKVDFAREGSTGPWLRFTFKKMYNNSSFQLSELRLMNAAGTRVDGGGACVNITSGVGAGTQGSAVQNVAANCAPKDMPPQSVWASDSNWLLSEPSNGYRCRTPSALFDGQTWSRLYYSTGTPNLATPSTWKTFIVRLPATTAEVVQYNLRNGYSGTSHPSDWTVETSADGVTWALADVQSGQIPSSSSGQFYNGGVHYKVYGHGTGAAGLLPASSVQVDRGATLDFSNVTNGKVLQNLTIDCADAGTGDGLIRAAEFGPSGVLDLVNVPADLAVKDWTIPLLFSDVAGTGNLSSWTVRVNGEVQPLAVACQSGRLCLLARGTIVIFR